MDTPLRLVFLGTGDIAVPSLRALAVEPGLCVAAVVTQPDRPAGRSLRLRPSPVRAAAEALGLPVQTPARLRQPDAVSALRSVEAGLFVVAAYGQILSREVLDLPPLGCLNIHASLLPRHRGAAPIHAAILAGDERTGITIMWVDEGLDTGDILLQRPCEIAPDETAGSLHDRLAALAPPAILEAVRLVRAGTAPRRPQDEALATCAPKLERADGLLDWSQTAHSLARRVRGLSPWPGSHARLPDGGALKIHRAQARPAPGAGSTPGRVTVDNGRLLVACGDGFIEILELQLPGSRVLSAADYLRGHEPPAALPCGDSPLLPSPHRLDCGQ